MTASPFLLNATISHHLNKYKQSDRNTIPDDVSFAKSMFESERSDSNQEQRILDVLWNTNTDKILLDFKQAQQSEPVKWNMAHLVAKIYDLLGFLYPVIAKLKIFFQSLWKEVIVGFSSAEPVTIDRCYLTTESNHY